MTFSENRNTTGFFILLIVTVYWTSCSNHSQINRNKALAGMYKLYAIESQDSTGAWIESAWANGGEGYIVYDGLGHMAVQITPRGYRDFKWLSEEQTLDEKIFKEKIDSMSLTELKAAVAEFASNYVYVANYSINDSANVVSHKRIASTIPSIWGTEVKRKFSISGDTLILINPSVNRRLTWVRQK